MSSVSLLSSQLFGTLWKMNCELEFSSLIYSSGEFWGRSEDMSKMGIDVYDFRPKPNYILQPGYWSEIFHGNNLITAEYVLLWLGLWFLEEVPLITVVLSLWAWIHCFVDTKYNFPQGLFLKIDFKLCSKAVQLLFSHYMVIHPKYTFFKPSFGKNISIMANIVLSKKLPLLVRVSSLEELERL